MPLADRPWFRLSWPLAVAAVAVGAGAVLSTALPGYFVFLAISAVVAAIAILGLGIVTGSAGCLLYTSPSPRDQRGSRMPSSA